MKTAGTAAIVVFVSLLVLHPAAWAGPDDPVHFDDANLQRAVRMALIVINDPPTEAQMASPTFTFFDAGSKNITDLTGLEYAINLTWLDVRGNHISDLSPLTRLKKLRALNLESNQISNLSPLAGLTNLEGLWLSDNQIRDLSLLAQLPDIEWLVLDNNQIRDLSPLIGWTTLDHLSLQGNPLHADACRFYIPEIESYGTRVYYDPCPVPFNDANLKQAVMDTLGISHDPTVAEMASPTFIVLDASSRSIADLTGLEYAINLVGLNLSGNQIRDLSPLKDLTNLTTLDLSGNQIRSLSGLENLKNLGTLSLSGNQIRDLSPLRDLKSLTTLWFTSNRISNLLPLKDLTNLTGLSLDENLIWDLLPLKDLTNLTGLNLRSNQIRDLQPLEKLTNLTGLSLDENLISDLSPLRLLPNLGALGLSGNQISDISPLKDLTNLIFLQLQLNPLHPDACTIHIPQIRLNNPRVSVYYDPCWELIPDVVGMSLGRAKQAIWGAGYAVAVTYAPGMGPAGRVILQSPPGDSLVAPGSNPTVLLTVSSSRGGPGNACLVAHWKLDETAGTTAADTSGNNYDGTVAGGAVWQPAGGQFDGALQFDGIDDYVDCGNPSALNIQDQITLACWIKAAAFTRTRTWQTILAKGDNSYELSRSSAGNSIYFGLGGTTVGGVGGATAVTGDEWHHIAGVYDGSDAVLYVDGAADTVVPATGRINSNSSNLFLGENAQARGQYFKGLLDDVRIYNCALTPADVALLAGPTGDPNLVGWWKLDETGGDIAFDSASLNDGVAYGAPVWQATGGVLGGALSFDGVDDYVDTFWAQDLPRWTVAVWVKSPAAPSTGGNPSGPLHREKNYQLNWDHPNGGSWPGCVAANIGGWKNAWFGSLQASTWYHLCGTFDGATLKAYTNGVLITTTHAVGTPDPEGNTLKLGSHAAQAYYFAGTVDDARVYDRALSAAEVQALAQ